jgi:hypothetical protein
MKLLILFSVLLLILIWCYITENFQQNKKIIIYLKRTNYLPLHLYANSLKNIFTKLSYDVELIEDFNKINFNDKFTFILFYLEINDDIISKLKEHKIKTILINTEYYLYWGVLDNLKKIHSNLDYISFEYNPLNMVGIKKEIPNSNLYYLPLLYDKYLVDFYDEHVPNKIPWNKKDIDVLFYGGVYENERRLNPINELKKKYNVVVIQNIETDYKYLLEHIERAKIIINLYQHENIKTFDYFRLSFLLANKKFFIYEYPDNINFTYDVYLKDFEKYLVVAKHNKFVETVSYYLDNYDPKLIEKKVNQQFEWFTKNSMEDELKKIEKDL